MVEHNPYHPSVNVAGEEPMGRMPSPDKAHTHTMVSHLKETRPWVMFMAILGFIGAGFMGIGGLSMIVVGAISGSAMKEAGGMGVGMLLLMSLIYLLAAFVYVYFSILLLRYASSINNLVDTEKTRYLEEALLRQKTFWKGVGIMTIIGLGLTIIGTLAAIIIGVVAASAST